MFECHLSTAVESESLAQAVAQVLNVSSSSIVCAENIEDIPVQSAIKIVTRKRAGDFPMSFTAFFSPNAPDMTEKEFAKNLCAVLNSSCLIDDGKTSPYSWLHVTPQGTATVHVDPEFLDHNDGFKLLGVLEERGKTP